MGARPPHSKSDGLNSEHSCHPLFTGPLSSDPLMIWPVFSFLLLLIGDIYMKAEDVSMLVNGLEFIGKFSKHRFFYGGYVTAKGVVINLRG